MKETLLKLADYNLWANLRLVAIFEKQSEELLTQRVPSSFPSIHATVLHIWDAETIWMNRLQGRSLTSFPSLDFKGDCQEAMQGWLSRSQAWKDFINGQEPSFFTQEIHYANTKGLSFHQPAQEIILHYTHHSSFHRGQLITICRQLGVFSLPSTDFILYLRQKQRENEPPGIE